MTTAPASPPAGRPVPCAETLAAIEDALTRIDDHVEVVRQLLTNTVSLTADMRRRIDTLKAGLQGGK